MSRPQAIDAFDLPEGRVLARKYEVITRLGKGWEGEVYLVRERATGIERAAKLFYPKRNLNNRTAKLNATKLHKLRNCPGLTQYVTQDTIRFRGAPITLFLSQFLEGELLSTYLARQRGKRVHYFEALHLLYALTRGVEQIHQAGEYHGDLHTENIIVRRVGIGFEVKLIDLFHRPAPKTASIQDDICDLVRVLYDAAGGARHYANLRPEVKYICAGLKRTLILRRFKTAERLRQHLEAFQWEA